jgi:hypothetical protein
MPKQSKNPESKRPAEMPDWPKTKAEPLTLTITIPAQVTPMFKCLAELTTAGNLQEFALWAITRGVSSSEAMEVFLGFQNDLIRG